MKGIGQRRYGGSDGAPSPAWILLGGLLIPLALVPPLKNASTARSSAELAGVLLVSLALLALGGQAARVGVRGVRTRSPGKQIAWDAAGLVALLFGLGGAIGALSPSP